MNGKLHSIGFTIPTQLPSEGWQTHKNSTRFEPEHKQPMLHMELNKDDESSGAKQR
jgi:hypothetical protein